MAKVINVNKEIERTKKKFVEVREVAESLVESKLNEVAEAAEDVLKSIESAKEIEVRLKLKDNTIVKFNKKLNK